MVMASGLPVPFVSNWICGRERTAVEKNIMTNLNERMLPDMVIEHATVAYQVDARTPERATVPCQEAHAVSHFRSISISWKWYDYAQDPA